MKKHIAGLFGIALLLAAASAHAQITQDRSGSSAVSICRGGTEHAGRGLQRKDHSRTRA